MTEERKMRAKLRVGSIVVHAPGNESLKLHGVAKREAYPADGSDENNSFARWSPSVFLDIQITNPALVGTFAIGDTFYVDFTPAPE